MSNINWHNVRMYALIVITFVVAGLSAIKGSVPGDLTTLLSVLVFVEHFLAGNTTPTV